MVEIEFLEDDYAPPSFPYERARERERVVVASQAPTMDRRGSVDRRGGDEIMTKPR